MKTITIEKNLYTFDELDADAKWRAYLDEFELVAEYVNDEYRLILDEHGISGGEPEWDMSACQGSGFTIYGDFSWNELARAAGARISDDDMSLHVDPNRHYTYFHWSVADVAAELDWEFNWPWPECMRSARIVVDFMEELCANMRSYADDLENDLTTSSDFSTEFYEGRWFDEFGKLVEVELL